MHLIFISVLLFGFPFIMTEVVDSFKKCKDFFLNGEPPMIKSILEKSVSMDNNNYKLICQKYQNVYRFATLYDKNSKIPVFSAYKYTGKKETFERPKGWMIEPQFETSTADMREPCVNQACTEDYYNKGNTLNRGHLFPNGHAADEITAKSTFTLTNIVPQNEHFNGGSWCRMETTVKKIMDTDCRDKDNPRNVLAYVLTGAVPNTKTPPDILNNKVNIPSHMWTVFCCYNSERKNWVSQAHWAENIDERPTESKTISLQSLDNLQEFLKKQYNKEITLFKDGCLDPLSVAGSQPPESDCDNEQNQEQEKWWSYIKNIPDKMWKWFCGN